MSEETLDALFDGRIKLYQSRAGYRFSLDALLLGRWAAVRERDHVVDLGAGAGVVSLILASCHPKISITALELQPALAERAERNVKLNGLEKRIQLRRGDVRRLESLGAPASADAVVCNPPYRRQDSGRISANDEKRIARHEIHGGLDDFLNAGTFLLRPQGRMALVYLASRTIDLLAALRAHKLEPKRLRLVHSFSDSDASLVLVEAVKGGRGAVTIEAPLIIYRQDHEYSAEAAAMIDGR